MRWLAPAFSVLILLGYAAVMHVDPDWGFLRPRGGMVMLGISLVVANAAIRASCQSHREPKTRFQLGAAGWIWLVVQAGATVYAYCMAAAA